MIKRLQRLTTLLIFMILCLTIGSPAVQAAENPSLELDVTVNLSGVLPTVPEDFLIKLAAEEIGNPMPEATLNGVYTMAVTGAGTKTFPKMTFSKVGIYNYRIWQQPGLEEDGYYDTTIYHLNVFVTNAPGGGLEITSLLYKNDEKEKSPEVIFDNRYAAPAVVRFTAQKLLDNKIPLDNQFTFVLTDASGTVLQTKKNLGDDVMFDEIALKETGARVFYLKEEKGSDPFILYDQTLYKITVNVSKNTIGDYVASMTMEVNGQIYSGNPIFRNRTLEIEDVSDKPKPELPRTGESKSMLPVVGVLLLIGGVSLNLNRKKTH